MVYYLYELTNKRTRTMYKIIEICKNLKNATYEREYTYANVNRAILFESIDKAEEAARLRIGTSNIIDCHIVNT